jgi:hypothetical protein
MNSETRSSTKRRVVTPIPVKNYDKKTSKSKVRGGSIRKARGSVVQKTQPKPHEGVGLSDIPSVRDSFTGASLDRTVSIADIG